MSEQADAGQDPRPGNNGYDPEKVRGYVERIEKIDGELESEKGSYMRTCQGLRGSQKDILEEAAEKDGIPRKELKAVLKARRLERKAEKVRAELESEQQDTYDLIRHALGDLADTPLGAAAAAKAPDAPGTPAFAG